MGRSSRASTQSDPEPGSGDRDGRLGRERDRSTPRANPAPVAADGAGYSAARHHNNLARLPPRRLSFAGHDQFDVGLLQRLPDSEKDATMGPAAYPLQKRKLPVDCTSFPPFADRSHGNLIVLNPDSYSILPHQPKELLAPYLPQPAIFYP